MNKVSSNNLTTFMSMDQIKVNKTDEFREQLLKKSLKLLKWANLGFHNQTEPYIKEIL